jgi:hypothetical protein
MTQPPQAGLFDERIGSEQFHAIVPLRVVIGKKKKVHGSIVMVCVWG